MLLCPYSTFSINEMVESTIKSAPRNMVYYRNCWLTRIYRQPILKYINMSIRGVTLLLISACRNGHVCDMTLVIMNIPWLIWASSLFIINNEIIRYQREIKRPTANNGVTVRTARRIENAKLQNREAVIYQRMVFSNSISN